MKIVFALLVLLSLLAGCASNQSPEQTTDTPDTSQTTTSTQSTTNQIPSSSATQPSSSQSTEASTTAPMPVTFTLFSPNETFDGFVECELTIDSLQPELIVQYLAEYGVLNMDVRVNSAVVEGNQLNLDMNEAFLMQIYSMGTMGEKMLMGSLVNTFLSAYGCEYVMVTADGEIIHSGHVDYETPMGPFQ